LEHGSGVMGEVGLSKRKHALHTGSQSASLGIAVSVLSENLLEMQIPGSYTAPLTKKF
jgi:hypothetical protein